MKIIRLHLLRNGILADGNLNLNIFDGAELIASKTLTFTELNSTGGTYWHGFISFEFDNAIFLSVDSTLEYKDFTLQFIMTDHTDDLDVYCGGCKEYERYIRNTVDDFRYPPLVGEEEHNGLRTDFANECPLAIEIYTLN